MLFVALIVLLSNFQLSRPGFSEKRHSGEDTLLDRDIGFWDVKVNRTPPPTVFTTTQAKLADSTETNPVTKLKTVQMRRSTQGTVAETPITVIFRKSFKKLPQWDFEDVYNQDAPPRQTVSLLRQDIKLKKYRCSLFTLWEWVNIADFCMARC